MEQQRQSHSDFRLRIQQEFMRRCEKNQSYSLRSFARQLGINHASLSSMLAGKRTLTAKTVKKLGAAIGLSPNEIEFYSQSVSQPPQVTETSTTTYFEINQDSFNAMAHWYYDAILELSVLPGFCPEPKWIAQVLDISATEASIAVETLMRLGLLVKNKSGRVTLSHRDSSNILDPDFTSAAMKKYQKAILEKSVEALESIDKKNREHASTTIAINTSDMPEFKKMLSQFRKKLTAFAQRAQARPDQVYQLQVSLFPLSRVQKEKKS